MNNETNLKCRKCGGAHFTIKCGKEKKPEIIIENNDKQNNDKQNDNDYKQNKKQNDIDDKKQYGFKKSENNFRNKFQSTNKITYRVKLSELPNDMTEEEMLELTSEWGHIIKVKVINYDENSVAYIDFGFEDEAKYFIEAIDKTPFESLLLSASQVESY
jgi:hypothetical protein